MNTLPAEVKEHPDPFHWAGGIPHGLPWEAGATGSPSGSASPSRERAGGPAASLSWAGDGPPITFAAAGIEAVKVPLVGGSGEGSSCEEE